MIYYYPNRPILVPPDPKHPLRPGPAYINSLEASGQYVAEEKWNGDNVSIHIEEDKVKFYNRYKQLMKYIPSQEVLDELALWPKNSVLNAELLHNKTVEIKHRLIVHCVMTWKGKHLIGKTWGDSRDILNECIEKGLSGEHIQISKVWNSHFWELFKNADGKTVEGIILKDPKGKLVFSAVPIKDVSWMLKIRKPCKKYPF